MQRKESTLELSLFFFPRANPHDWGGWKIPVCTNNGGKCFTLPNCCRTLASAERPTFFAARASFIRSLCARLKIAEAVNNICSAYALLHYRLVGWGDKYIRTLRIYTRTNTHTHKDAHTHRYNGLQTMWISALRCFHLGLGCWLAVEHSHINADRSYRLKNLALKHTMVYYFFLF